MKTFSLNGKWEYAVDPKDAGEKLGYFGPHARFKSGNTMNIPSNWQVAGLDDYSGTVWFKKEFDGPVLKDDEDVILRFSGVDYFAKVWLNGRYLGEHEGYFQPFEFDVTEHLQAKNCLIVKVSSPAEPAGKNAWPHRKRLIKGVFGHHDVRPGAWHEKLGQTKGTGGIWNVVEIIVCKKIRLSGMKISPKIKEDHSVAELDMELFAENTMSSAKKTLVVVEITGPDGKIADMFRSGLELRPGINVFDVKAKLQNPLLWWPRELGRQDMYLAKASLFDEASGEPLSVSESRFGVRDIRIDRKSVV